MENQLSPCSIGISPLPTIHPKAFQRSPVRSSTHFYLRFNLIMGRSLQFRVYEHQLFALFRLAFAPAPHFLLNLAGARNSLAHSSIGTPSLALRLLVDIRFQVLFHSAPAVLFTFPSRYYALSVTKKCLALEGGPPDFPQNSSCFVVLWIPAPSSFLSPTRLLRSLAYLSR